MWDFPLVTQFLVPSHILECLERPAKIICFGPEAGLLALLRCRRHGCRLQTPSPMRRPHDLDGGVDWLVIPGAQQKKGVSSLPYPVVIWSVLRHDMWRG